MVRSAPPQQDSTTKPRWDPADRRRVEEFVRAALEADPKAPQDRVWTDAQEHVGRKIGAVAFLQDFWRPIRKQLGLARKSRAAVAEAAPRALAEPEAPRPLPARRQARSVAAATAAAPDEQPAIAPPVCSVVVSGPGGHFHYERTSDGVHHFRGALPPDSPIAAGLMGLIFVPDALTLSFRG